MEDLSVTNLLLSDKPTVRRRGKEEVERLVRDDIATNGGHVPSRWWWDLMFAVLQWETRELQHAAKKTGATQQLYTNAPFVRLVVLHGSTLCHFSHLRVAEIVAHSLRVLYDNTLPSHYKDEHREMLAELLANCKFSYYLALEELVSLLNYMKVVADPSALGHRSVQRMLRTYPSALYRDLLQTGLLEPVVEFYISLLDSSLNPSGQLSTRYPTILVVAELFNSILNFYGKDSIDLVSSSIVPLLKGVPRALVTVQTGNKDVLLSFLCKFASVVCSDQACTVLRHGGILREMYTIFDAMASDEALRTASIVVHQAATSGSASSKLGRDGRAVFTRSQLAAVSNDSQVVGHFEALASVVRVIYLFFHYMAPDQPRSVFDDRLKLPLGELLERFSDAISTLSNEDQLVAATQASRTQLGMPGSTQALSAAHVMHSRTNIGHISAGLALLLSPLARFNQIWWYSLSNTRGKMLGVDSLNFCTSSHNSSIGFDDVVLLCDWIREIWKLLVLASQTSLLEKQLLGVVILTLSDLLPICNNIWKLLSLQTDHNVLASYHNSIDVSAIDPNLAELVLNENGQASISNPLLRRLRIEWFRIFQALLTNVDPWRRSHAAVFSNQSFVAEATNLVYNLVDGKIIDCSPAHSLFKNYVDRSNIIFDPRNIECPQVFMALSLINKVSPKSIPSDLHLHLLEREVFSSCPDIDSYLRETGFDGATVVGVASYLIGWLECVRTGPRQTQRVNISSTAIFAIISRTFSDCFDRGKRNSTLDMDLSRRDALQIDNWLPFDGSAIFERLQSHHAKYLVAISDPTHLSGFAVDEPVPKDHRVPTFDNDSINILSTYASLFLSQNLTVDEKAEGISNGMLSAIGLLAAISAIVQNASENSLTLYRLDYLTGAASFCWRLVIAIMEECLRKYGLSLMRDADILEVCFVALECLPRLLNFEESKDQTSTLRSDCVEALRRLLICVHTTGCPKQKSPGLRRATSATAVDDLDFNDDFYQEPKARNTTSPRTQSSEDDQLWGDAELDIVSTGRTSSASRSTTSNAKATPSLRFTQDGILLFSLLSRLMVMCETCEAEHIVSFVTAVLRHGANVSDSVETFDPTHFASIAPSFAVKSEYQLFLAQSIADIAPCDTLFDLLQAPWDKEWSGLGYARVLCILRTMLHSNKDCFSPDLFSSAVNDIIIGGYKNASEFPSQLWYIRVCQLIATRELLKINSSRYKEVFASIVLKGLTDYDERVRYVAAVNLSLIFATFTRNPYAIYRSMIGGLREWTGQAAADLCGIPGRHHALSKALSIIGALSLIPKESSSVTPLVLRDILFLRASCIYVVLAQADLKSAIDNAVLKALLHIASTIGYCSIKMLMQDHLSYIFQQWISARTDQILLQGPFSIKLFPTVVIGARSDWKDFLNMVGCYLIPAICISDASDRRWSLLSDLCQDAGIGATDANIAKLLLDNIVYTLALDTVRIGALSLGLSSELPDSYVRDFVLRIVDSSELKRREKNHVRLVLCEMILAPTLWDIKAMHVDSNSNEVSVEEILWQALRSCTKSADSASSKTSQQNAHTAALLRSGGLDLHLFEIVSLLISRAKDSRSIWAIDGICAVSNVLIDIFLPIHSLPGSKGIEPSDILQYSSILFVLCQELLANPSVVPQDSALRVLDKFIRHIVEVSNQVQILPAPNASNELIIESFRLLVDDIYFCVAAMRDFVCREIKDEYLSNTYGNNRLRVADKDVEVEIITTLLPICCALVAKLYVSGRWDVSALGTSIDSSMIANSLPALIQMTVQYCESILWGFPWSRNTLWMLLCQVNSVLSATTVCHESYSKFGATLASFGVDDEERKSQASDVWDLASRESLTGLLGCLICLVSKFQASPTSESNAIMRQMYLILGSIGAPDPQKVHHGDIRVKFNIFGRDPYDEYDPNCLKLRFVYNLVTDVLLLKSESANRSLIVLLRLFRSDSLTSIMSHDTMINKCAFYLRFPLDKLMQSGGANAGSELMPSSLKLVHMSDFGSKSGLTESIWDPRGKSFDVWLSHFMTVITTSMSSQGSPYFITATADVEFLKTVSPMFPVLTSAVKYLFSLLLETLVENSATELVTSHISQRFDNCFLKLEWDVSQAINKIGCQFLWYILQKKKREFLQNPSQQVLVRGRKRKAAGGDYEQTESASSRYGYVLNVDPMVYAKVAASCGLVGMANILIEYYGTTSASTRFSNPDTASLLRKLSGDIHDGDFIFGVPQTESSLDVEGLIFAHSGKWREALAAYESSLSSANGTFIDDSSRHIAVALKGLGFSHVLSSFQKATRADAISSRIHDLGSLHEKDLSSWDLFDGITSMMKKGRSSTTLVVRDKAEVLSKRLSIHANEETFSRAIPVILNIQQLHEVEEALSIASCSRTTSLIRPGAAEVFERWRNRMEAAKSSSSLGIDVISARLHFVEQMLQSQLLKPVEALACFQQFQQVATKTDAAHSFSPLLYSFISGLQRSCTDSNETARGPPRLVEIESKLSESLFLWNKSLGDMAISTLKGSVIQPIRENLSALLTEIQTSGRSRNSGAATLLQQQQSLVVRLRHNLSLAYLLGGQWLAAKKNMPGMAVINDYLQLAVDFAEEHHQKILALKTLAHYNHKLYLNIRNRMASSEWIQGMQLAQDRQQELERCKTQARALQANTKRSSTEEQEFRNMLKHLRVLQKEIEIDVAEKQLAEVSLHQHLLHAISNFGSVLSQSSAPNVDIVFLVISLWFENQTITEVNKHLHEIVDSTQSFKFVPLSYQILSRINVEGFADGASRSRGGPPETEQFSTVINRLASKLALDHPYHIIPQLLALANEDYAPSSLQKAPSTSASRSSLSKGLSASDQSANQRIIAAKTILSQSSGSGAGRSVSKSIYKAVVDSLSALTEDYICLAFAPIDKFVAANRFSDIPFSELGSVFTRFSALGSGHMCPIMSKSVSIRSDNDYSDVVKLVKFLPNFSITETGITRPKILSCVGSDGAIYKQLVKGNDDLRQDAVMEQVFDHVNIMLQRSEVTNRKSLRIRTYKVVPMTRQCGVVEWVNKTIPFGSYLIDKNTGAHSRYYPDDLGHSVCRRLMQGDVSSDDAAAGAKTKEELFSYVCSRFHPVFRYFFLERYNDPAQWLGCRIAYTRSVAAVSMIGYILGIGDRHSHNILVDTATAEVVHIDFGIMFEQGKVLGCPETVPFRLTRDVVDGMGVTGVEGSFRRCCEDTLQVLRDNQQHILTILEVVIHDPLYKWTLSPKLAKQRQRGDHDEGNFRSALRGTDAIDSSAQSSSRDAGQRTLLRVRNKLQGHDDPGGDTFTVQGQVEYLVQEAQSVANLSKLFPGWAPWL